MSIDLTYLENDLTLMIADIPATIGIDGTDYTVAASEVTEGVRMEMEGLGLSASIQFVGKVSDFASVPPRNKLVTHNGKTYRIESTVKSPCGKAFVLLCSERSP